MATNKPCVLITGAQGGIGKAFIADNYDVIATDVIDAAFELGYGVSVQSDFERIAIDGSYANEFKERVDNITGESELSALINNAAVQIPGATKELTRSQWQTSFNVNLHAPFFLSQLFLDDLAKNEGAIVNINSIHMTQTKKKL
jgi:NAD(P)-dependent dehydrogenase (short-subunit alcohol dehydrogenase family)